RQRKHMRFVTHVVAQGQRPALRDGDSDDVVALAHPFGHPVEAHEIGSAGDEDFHLIVDARKAAAPLSISPLYHCTVSAIPSASEMRGANPSLPTARSMLTSRDRSAVGLSGLQTICASEPAERSTCSARVRVVTPVPDARLMGVASSTFATASKYP